MSSMAQIFNCEIMTELVKLFEPDATNLHGLNKIAKEDVRGQTAKWDQVSFSRDLATFNVPNSEAKISNQITRKRETANFAYIREKKILDPDTLYWLEQPGKENVQYGEQLVKDELLDLNGKVDRLVEYMIWQMFTGTLTVAQTDVKFAVDYGIPSANKAAPSTKWDQANCTILKDISAFKQIVVDAGGGMPDTVYMTQAVMDTIIADSTVRDYFKTQHGLQVMEGGKIDRPIAGLNPVIIDGGYDVSGTFTKFISAKHIIITKGLGDKRYHKLQQGASLDTKAGGKPGKFSKSWEEEDPSLRQMLLEWYCLPILCNPYSVYYSQVLT